MNKDSIAIVTGANSGMGKATSVELAKSGTTVVMVCRNGVRGKAALNEVKQKSASSKIKLMLCDLGSIESIEGCCRNYKNNYNRLDVLVNNAGVILPGRRETIDGFELQFGVNHLGHFLLTNLLLDIIKASSPARIINVSSGAHKIGHIYFNDINLEKNYRIWRAYGQSKLANILFTRELADRLKGSGVTVNCLHPGAVSTNMGVNRQSGFGRTITRALKPFFQTAEEGAETAIYLALSPEVEHVTGDYFYKKKIVSSSN